MTLLERYNFSENGLKLILKNVGLVNRVSVIYAIRF